MSTSLLWSDLPFLQFMLFAEEVETVGQNDRRMEGQTTDGQTD